MEGHCIKCREMIEMEDPRKLIMKDGKRWIKGACPKCGTAVWKRLEGEDAHDLVYAYHLG